MIPYMMITMKSSSASSESSVHMMPRKDPWSYKKRRRTKKVKHSLQEKERSMTEHCRTSDTLGELSTSTELVSQKALDLPLKKEEIIYPDTRFQRSTTLFPAEGTIIDDEKEDLTSDTSSVIFKRCAEKELVSAKSKKLKENDPPKSIEPTIPDDVIVIEKPQTQVKVDLIDLTEESHPVVKLFCSPTKTSHLGNRLPGKPKTTFEDNDFLVKDKSNESNTITDIVSAAGINCHTIQVKAEQKKTCKNNCHISANMSYICNSKKINPPTENSLPSEVEDEDRIIMKENSDKVNLNQSHGARPLDNYVQIKAKQSQLNENNTGSNFGKSHVVASPNIATENSRLSSELDKETDDSGEAEGQVCTFSKVSDCNAKDVTNASDVVNHSLNAAIIKVEQNDIINSIPVNNFSSHGEPISMNTDAHPIQSLQNNTNANCEFSDIAAEDRILNENSDKDNLNQSHVDRRLGNHVQVKAERSEWSENNAEINFGKSHIVVSRHPNITTDNSSLSSELDKETDDSGEVDGQVCISGNVSDCNAKDVTNASDVVNHSLNAVTIKVEQNDIISDNSIPVSNFSSHGEPISMNTDAHPIHSLENNTNANCEFSDKAAEDRILNEKSDKDNLNQSHAVRHVGNHIQIKVERSELGENNTEINFGKSHIVASRHPNITTNYSRFSSEMDKETDYSRGVDGLVCTSSNVSDCNAKDVTNASDVVNHSLNAFTIKVEQNDIMSDNPIPVSNISSRDEPKSINIDDHLIQNLQNNTNANCEFSDRAAEDRIPIENSDKVNLNQFRSVRPLDNDVHIKADLSENNTEINFGKSHIVASRHSNITIDNSRSSSGLDKETDDSGEAEGQVCTSSNVSDCNAKYVTNASDVVNHSLNAATIKVEQNDIINSIPVNNFSSHGEPISMNTDDHPIKSLQSNTNDKYECSDIAAKDRILNENSDKVNLNQSHVVRPLDNHVQIKAEQSELNEDNSEINFEKSHIVANRYPEITTDGSHLSSELDKETDDSGGVDGLVCTSSNVSDCNAKDVTNASDVVNHSLNAVTINVEQNDIISDNSIPAPNFSSHGEPISMNTDDHPIKSLQSNTNDKYECSDIAAKDRILNENSDKVNLNQSHVVRPLDNHVQIKPSRVKITTDGSHLSSELDKETDDSGGVDGLVCTSSNVSDCNAKDVTNASDVVNHSLNAVTINVEQNDIISDNSIPVSNFSSHGEPISMNTDAHPIQSLQNNTNANCEFNDTAAEDRILNEKSDKDNLNQSHAVRPLDNHVQIKAELSESNTEINFEKSHIIASLHPDITTVNSRYRSRLDIETDDNKGVDGQVCISSNVSDCNAKYLTIASNVVNHLLNAVTIKMEQNDIMSDNPIPVSNFSTHGEPKSMNTDDRPIQSLQNNTNANCELSDIVVPCLSSVCRTEISSGIFSRESEPEKMDFQENSVKNELQNYGDIQQESTDSNIGTNAENSSKTLFTNISNWISISPISGNDIFGDGDSEYKPGTFATPLIKYLNCNKKTDMLEIYHTKTALNLYRSATSFHAQEKSELYLSEKWEVSSNLQINEKPSFNLNIDEITNKISSLLNFFKPNITHLDSNSASSPFWKFVDEREKQNSLNSDGLCVGMRQNNSPNFLFESSLKVSESWPGSVSNSQIEDSPMDIQNSVKDYCPSAICLPPLDYNKRSETCNGLSTVSVENPNEKLLSKDFLFQILNNVKTTANINVSSNPPIDPIVKSNINIDDSIFENLRQIDFLKIKPVESTDIISDLNKKNYECIAKNSEMSPHNFSAPNENISNPSTSYDDTFETPPKRVKKCKDTAAFEKNARKISYEEYKKRDKNVITHPPIHQLNSYFQSHTLGASPISSNFEQNMHTPLKNRQNHDIHIYNDIALRNPYLQRSVNTSPNDPRLTRNNSPLNRDLNSEKHLDSFNNGEISPHHSVPETAKLTLRVHRKRAISASETNASNEPFCHSDFNQPTSKRNRIALLPTPSFRSNSLTVPQPHPVNSVSGVKNCQPLFSLPNLSANASSSSSPQHHFVSQGIHPQMSRHPESTHDQYSSVNVKRQFMPYPPRLINNPPLVIPSNTGPCNSFASERSPNQSTVGFHFESLIPKQIKDNIGKKIVDRDNVYPIIIERNTDWLYGFNVFGNVRTCEMGFELQRVRFNYVDHLTHYNTYFPLLLVECFSNISTCLKKRKTDTKTCKIVDYSKDDGRYVKILCESFIHYSEVETIPTEDYIVLVKFGTSPAGGIKMLGYVLSSCTRPYSQIHDHGNELLKFLKVDNFKDVVKFKILFSIVFEVPGIDLTMPIEITRLTSIKKVLMMNEALAKLPESPLCNIVLNPRGHVMKSIALPPSKERDSFITVAQEAIQFLKLSSPQLILLKCAPFTDSELAIIMFVEEILKSEYPGKILVCVRREILSEMGKNLLKSTRNLVILSREKEYFQTNIHNRVLDVKISHLSENRNITKEEAKNQVLEESKVLLAVTGTCFYEDVGYIVKDLTCCIIHDANSYTEPETLLPLLYKIRHLLLFGDLNKSPINSRFAMTLGYNKSLFYRAHMNKFTF
ncbi:hypothetical protein HNY73_017866 [Argiope bruennichi]|uniref:Uncharacterized protein n=1 Tax=Argiope bruennichi TaxID=94029 RepID=A0A8T0EBZ7_ARGBR|nr:hypothetical protein HNY73_017866 [Argiope bruennichi]